MHNIMTGLPRIRNHMSLKMTLSKLIWFNFLLTMYIFHQRQIALLRILIQNLLISSTFKLCGLLCLKMIQC